MYLHWSPETIEFECPDTCFGDGIIICLFITSNDRSIGEADSLQFGLKTLRRLHLGDLNEGQFVIYCLTGSSYLLLAY